jgi:hypothetical protein
VIALKVTAPSHTVIGNEAPNCQLRSKAHTAPTGPVVLHHKRIGKCAIKKFGINCQVRNKNFLIIIFHFSLVKATMNALHLFKLRKDCLTGIGNGARVLTKTSSISSFSNFQRQKKDHYALANCGGVELLNLN